METVPSAERGFLQ